MRIFKPKNVDEGLHRFCADCANLGDCIVTDCPLRKFSPHPRVKRAVREARIRTYDKETKRYEQRLIKDLKKKAKKTTMKTSFIIASHQPALARECVNSIRESIGTGHQFIVIDTRPEKLSIFQAYDLGVEEARYSLLCFIHEDAKILSAGYWIRDVEKYMADPKVGVLGVAGSKDLTGTGRWWEGMGQPGGNRLSGMAVHTTEGGTWSNSYGQFDQVLVLDGLCLILKKSLYEELKGFHYKGMPAYEGFDFYDIDLTFRAHLAGYKNYAIPLLIEHQSIGTQKETWFKNKDLFVAKYKEHLPARL